MLELMYEGRGRRVGLRKDKRILPYGLNSVITVKLDPKSLKARY